MKKLIAGGLLTATLATGGVVTLTDYQTVSADADESFNQSHMLHVPEEVQEMIENGEITLEELRDKRDKNRDHERSKEEVLIHDFSIIDNGVVIEITTEDEEALERLQERLAHGPPEGAEADGEHAFASAINRELNTIENGVEITITSEDPDIIEKIQERAEEGHFPSKHHGKRTGGR